MQFLNLSDGSTATAVDDFQPQLAIDALGSGGISGVGLGASRIKWRGLPAAQDDYIFAIIGEELGLLGTLLVILLFVALAIGITRVVRRHTDPFAKITTAAIGAWVIGQAFVNIGVVIGLLPVIGVPLPLVSAGGSSLITTLIALGVLLSFARTEPGAREALAARRGSVRRPLAVLAPRLRRGGAARSAARGWAQGRARRRRHGRARQPAAGPRGRAAPPRPRHPAGRARHRRGPRVHARARGRHRPRHGAAR